MRRAMEWTEAGAGAGEKREEAVSTDYRSGAVGPPARKERQVGTERRQPFYRKPVVQSSMARPL